MRDKQKQLDWQRRDRARRRASGAKLKSTWIDQKKMPIYESSIKRLQWHPAVNAMRKPVFNRGAKHKRKRR
jgi:hypothetical protein